jgi:hypothetical protein
MLGRDLTSQYTFPFRQLKSVPFLRQNEMAITHLGQEPLKAITRFVYQVLAHKGGYREHALQCSPLLIHFLHHIHPC